MKDLPSEAFAEMIRKRDEKVREYWIGGYWIGGIDTEKGLGYCEGYVEGINEGLRIGLETAQSFMESLTGAHATGQ